MNKKQRVKKILLIASIVLATFSVVNFWVNGLISTYYDITEFKVVYSLILLASAMIAFIGFAISIIALIKANNWKYRALFIFCAIISLAMVALELISVSLINWFGLYSSSY